MPPHAWVAGGAATRWPSGEPVDDRSQGVQLAPLKALARYWETDYDWRKAEAKLNALPQFTTEIDGVGIHFIHVKSAHENALPLFSGEPTELGWGPGRVAAALAELTRRLGCTRYVAQGGDVGSAVTDAMGRQAPEGLIGMHLNLLLAALAVVDQLPKDSERERAAWMLDHDTDSYVKISRAFPGEPPAGHLTPDRIVDNITLYWLTGTGASAARAYWETRQAQAAAAAAGQAPPEVSIPVAFTTFPGEIFPVPRSWVEKVYPSLTYFDEIDRGGHFAAWEEPELFLSELREAFRPLR